MIGNSADSKWKIFSSDFSQIHKIVSRSLRSWTTFYGYRQNYKDSALAHAIMPSTLAAWQRFLQYWIGIAFYLQQFWIYHNREDKSEKLNPNLTLSSVLKAQSGIG